MKQHPIDTHNTESIESIVAYCGGMPQGDELPQVASEDDIAIDVFNDLANMPREFAAAYLHHQIEDDRSFH